MSQPWKILWCLKNKGCMAWCNHVLPYPVLHHAVRTTLFLIMILNEIFRGSHSLKHKVLTVYYLEHFYAVSAVAILQFIFYSWWKMFTYFWFTVIFNKQFSSKLICFNDTNLRCAFHFYDDKLLLPKVM